MKPLVAIMSLGLLWGVCSAPLRLMQTFVSTSTPTPTPTPTPTHTPEPTISPTPLPSATLVATLTPSSVAAVSSGLTLSPTPTYVIPSLSPTSTPLSLLDCTLDWQSPGNGIEIKREEHFTVGWRVTNSGIQTWNPGSTIFTYVGGAKLQRDSVLQLTSSVPPGSSVTLTVEMRAPSNSTLYTTYWSLRQDDTFFCPVSVSVYAK